MPPVDCAACAGSKGTLRLAPLARQTSRRLSSPATRPSSAMLAVLDGGTTVQPEAQPTFARRPRPSRATDPAALSAP
jgi:hypothetical protein